MDEHNWNPTQIIKHHYYEYGASHLDILYVYRAYWITGEMKISVVVASCCEDSKVAVKGNTGWNAHVKRNTKGRKGTVFDWIKTEELGRMKDHFVTT